MNHNGHAALIRFAEDLPQPPHVLGIIQVDIGIAKMQLDAVVSDAPNREDRYATIDLEMKRKAIEQAQAIDHGASVGLTLWRTDASILTWLEAL